MVVVQGLETARGLGMELAWDLEEVAFHYMV
jgi:hypothetical protein